MEKLLIQGNRKNPTVILDPDNGLFELKGNSIPEDAGAFYKPIIHKIEEYFMAPYPLTVVSVELKYYNSSTSKWLLNMFQIFKKYSELGYNIFYKWYYDDGDEESYYTAKDYSDILNIPIKLLKAS